MAKILIVEDYESIRSIYQDAFARAGYEVETAKSGADALLKLAGKQFDVILLDMLMLELSGMEFLKSVDFKKNAPKTKIIALSNIDNQKIIQQATAYGVSRYLVKAHYTPQQVVDIVGEVLNPSKPKASS